MAILSSSCLSYLEPCGELPCEEFENVGGNEAGFGFNFLPPFFFIF